MYLCKQLGTYHQLCKECGLIQFYHRFFIKVSHSSCIGQTEGLGENSKSIYEVCNSKSEKSATVLTVPLHIIVLLLYRGMNFNILRVEFGGLCSGYEIRKTLN